MIGHPSGAPSQDMHRRGQSLGHQAQVQRDQGPAQEQGGGAGRHGAPLPGAGGGRRRQG